MSDAADKAPLGNYEHLKGLEPLIGTWAGEWDIPQDRPTANIKKGNYTLTVTWKWEVFQSALSLHYAVGQPGSDPIWRLIMLIGWDTASKRIICTAFEATGGHARVDDWEIQGDKVTFKGKGSLPAGNKTAWTMIYSDINKDSCTTQMTDVLVDGQASPSQPGWKVMLKRVEAR